MNCLGREHSRPNFVIANFHHIGTYPRNRREVARYIQNRVDAVHYIQNRREVARYIQNRREVACYIQNRREVACYIQNRREVACYIKNRREVARYIQNRSGDFQSPSISREKTCYIISKCIEIKSFKFIYSGCSTLRPYYEKLKKEKGRINGQPWDNLGRSIEII